MSALLLPKRLAASILKCGERKIWFDPNETSEIQLSVSRQSVRRLIKDGLIIKKPVAVHTRFRAKKRAEARRKGRHRGLGKRKGTANARMPEKIIWMKRIRVLRNLLKKYREQKKIDKHLYREFYLKCKGNVFKSKKGLIEHIRKRKAEILRSKALTEQAEARRMKNKDARKRRQDRVANRYELLAGKKLAEMPKSEPAIGDSEQDVDKKTTSSKK
ncbi:hypothetical protein GJ496_005605 [Pomphorhynchus laevis]|nr:hypothetical protein GJ496_005605 [Pomphorhynchus laevis]